MRSPTPVALVAALALGCSPTVHHALLDRGGVAEGSPVLVSGVRVGRVESVRVVESRVDIGFVFEGDHQVTLRADSCATITAGETGAALMIVPGTQAPLATAHPLPQCHLTADTIGDVMGSLGQGLGAVMRAIQQQVGNGAAPTGAPTAPPPGAQPGFPAPPPGFPAPPPFPSTFPAPSNADPACAALRLRVDGIEPATPPEEGSRMWLVFENEGDRALEIPPITRATFTDSEQRVLRGARRADGEDGWFRRFEVPPHGARRVSVAFDSDTDATKIQRVEIPDVGPAGTPLERCTVERSDLGAH